MIVTSIVLTKCYDSLKHMDLRVILLNKFRINTVSKLLSQETPYKIMSRFFSRPGVRVRIALGRRMDTTGVIYNTVKLGLSVSLKITTEK